VVQFSGSTIQALSEDIRIVSETILNGNETGKEQIVFAKIAGLLRHALQILPRLIGVDDLE
jgi:hypothetical protein